MLTWWHFNYIRIFTSNLTGKTYYSESTEPLNCTTKTVIFGIECTLGGLTFVGETKQLLGTRMNGYMYNINNPPLQGYGQPFQSTRPLY